MKNEIFPQKDRNPAALRCDGCIRCCRAGRGDEETMTTLDQAVEYALSLPGTYADKPFGEDSWLTIRSTRTKKILMGCFEYHGVPAINVKGDPQWNLFWRDAFPSVIPGFHMNKEHWNTILLDGTVPDADVQRMIDDSYNLVK